MHPASPVLADLRNIFEPALVTQTGFTYVADGRGGREPGRICSRMDVAAE